MSDIDQVRREELSAEGVASETPAKTGEPLPASDIAVATTADSATGVAKRRGTFAVGHDPRRNSAGRPKKGATVLDLTMAELHKRRRGAPTRAQQAAAAHVDRMMLMNQVGNQAWNAVVPYESGLPKQTFVHEHGDNPMLEFLRFAAEVERQAAIESEYRDVTSERPEPA